jgi:hypothetical protein
MASANVSTITDTSIDSYSDSIRVFYTSNIEKNNAYISTNIKYTYIDDYGITQTSNVDATSQTNPTTGSGSALITGLKPGTNYTFEVTNTYSVRGKGNIGVKSSLISGTTGTDEVGYIDATKTKIAVDENTAVLKYYYIHNDDTFISVNVYRDMGEGNEPISVSSLGEISDPKADIIELNGLSPDTTYSNIYISLTYTSKADPSTQKQLTQTIDTFTTKPAVQSNFSSISVEQDENLNIVIKYSIQVNDEYNVETKEVRLLDGKGNVIAVNSKIFGNLNEGQFVIGDNTNSTKVTPFEIKSGTTYSFELEFTSLTNSYDAETNEHKTEENIITSSKINYLSK